MIGATKSRHGCLTTWLVLMIVANSATALMYLFGSEAIRRALPSAPGWVFPVLGVFALFNLVCSVALLQWKKWGFLGFSVSSVVTLAVNLSMGLGLVPALGGLLGLLVLYGVLQIGRENKGWPQLE